MRVVGVDFGGTRIGIAVGETEPEVASPRAAIKASGTLRVDAGQIKDIYSKEMATAVVVGLPLGSEGEDTKMSKVCRKLGDEIAKLGCPVHYADEAFTSVNATTHLRDHDWTAATRRKHIDSEAACQILERFFRVIKDASGGQS